MYGRWTKNTAQCSGEELRGEVTMRRSFRCGHGPYGERALCAQNGDVGVLSFLQR